MLDLISIYLFQLLKRILKSRIFVFPSPFKSDFPPAFKKLERIILKSRTFTLPSPFTSDRFNEETGAELFEPLDDPPELPFPEEGIVVGV